MSERGYVVIDRGIFDHPVLESGESFSYREAWVWLIAEAAWKPQQRLIKGRVVILKRGQVAHSLRFMAQRWGWSVKRVRHFLNKLSASTMGYTEVELDFTVITICKYDEYQNLPRQDNKEKGTNRGTAGAQQGHKPNTRKQHSSSLRNEEECRAHARATPSVELDLQAAGGKNGRLEVRSHDYSNGSDWRADNDRIRRARAKLKASVREDQARSEGYG